MIRAQGGTALHAGDKTDTQNLRAGDDDSYSIVYGEPGDSFSLQTLGAIVGKIPVIGVAGSALSTLGKVADETPQQKADNQKAYVAANKTMGALIDSGGSVDHGLDGKSAFKARDAIAAGIKKTKDRSNNNESAATIKPKTVFARVIAFLDKLTGVTKVA